MTKRICVIPGDGIGPEVVASAVAVLKASGADLRFDEHQAGLACHAATGAYLPDATREAALASDAVLFGAITSPLARDDPDYKSVILALRQALDLYANVRPARDHGQPCLVPGLDLIIFRENSEGLYNVPELADDEGVTTLRRVSKRGTERITRFAFEWASRHGRRAVTCVHKANVLRQSDGLFRDTFLRVAQDHPTIATNDMLVDNCALQLVRDPKRFDTIVTLNLYGDVLSDEASGLVGGLGFAPSGSYGPAHALFEPVHGSAPDIAGTNAANPIAAILSAAMLLDHVGDSPRARAVEAAVTAAMKQGKTRDAGGDLTTTAFTQLVVDALP